MDKKKKEFDKIDELIDSTSSDKRFKFEEIIPDYDFSYDEDAKPKKQKSAAKKEAAEPIIKEPVTEEPKAEPVPNMVEVKPVEDEAIKAEIDREPQGVRIIDETSTTIVFEEDSDVAVEELVPTGKKAKKAKQPKEKIKFSVLQIVLMAVVGVVALWCIMFTVDHTLAAQGISPVFCRQTAVYEDNSASYAGVGYKIQFKFDARGNLSQKCFPAWQDGPNDVDISKDN